MIQDFESEEEKCHYCQIRKFERSKLFPIAIKNDTYDGARLPQNFKFIQKSIISPDVIQADPEFYSGCDCKGNDTCDGDSCGCLADMNEGPDGKRSIVYDTDEQKRAYLKSEVLESRDPIYECHSACSCGPDCKNRVVERGRKVSLHIFRTRDGRGWGMCSCHALFAYY